MLTKLIFSLPLLWPVLGLPNPLSTNELAPSTAVIHDTHWSSQNTCTPPSCRVYKSPTSNGHDLTTMLTFKYPAGFAGKQCWLEFFVPQGGVGTGGHLVDIFRQWQPVETCPSQGNNRDIQLGRMEIPVGGGKAGWTERYSRYLTEPTKCPVGGTIEGFEVVGVGDAEDVNWKQGVGVGVRVVYTT
ncbi:hypothetical protein OQA88_13512 [Cercophora sp. LCS_1]